MICQDCFSFYNQTVARGCEICTQLNFPEVLLCDLLRSEKDEFTCEAFRPKLQLVVNRSNAGSRSPDDPETDNIRQNKWLQAYLLQKLKEQPDEIQFTLKYILVLIARSRAALFSDTYFDSFSRIFPNAATAFPETTLDLMWVAPDHVHLFLDSTPDFSVDEICRVVGKRSERAILTKHPELKARYRNLWEDAYFVQTIG